jgi:hypothetical protein
MSETEWDLYGHLAHHKVIEWLKNGAREERAHTILNALKTMSRHQEKRLLGALAYVLAHKN